MVFCDKCGAYIPDGQTKCLACGYEKGEYGQKEQRNAEAASACQTVEEPSEKDSGKYYSFSNDELRERLEQQRKKQQEQSRKWAEQEKARRQTAASAAERRNKTAEDTEEKIRAAVGAFSKNSKWLSALSYVGILFALPFLLARDDSFAIYHAKQGAVLFLYGILSRVLGFIPLVGTVLKLFFWYCIYKGMSNSINGIKEPLPYIGQMAEKF